MSHPFRRCAILLLCLCICLCLLPAAAAAEETQTEQAKNLSNAQYVTTTGFSQWKYFFDGSQSNSSTASNGGSITVSYEEGVGSVYFLLRKEYGEYTVTNNDTKEVKTVGQGSFLHEYVDIQALFGTAPTSVTLRFENEVKIIEFYAFSKGKTPDFVQKWELPKESHTDLILFSTHGDDEQLFFAGLLPYYAKAMDYEVLVVYLTDHRNITQKRVHEMLDGLWAVGCTTYPVFGTFADFLKDSLEETYAEFRRLGTTKEDIVEFCVEQLRRFKPQVVVGHDFAGEYEHGQHMVYADCLADALELAKDPAELPELAAKYGTWDTPKAYFHLYQENAITMDWDTPMEELDGMTPFQVTQKLGYPCHASQQYTWFTGWINGKYGQITKASEIATHSPCQFGLYRTTVGPDVKKNDFFENIIIYAEQDRIAEEQRQKEEQARLEAERIAEEKRRQEEQLRQEEEARRQEEQARLEAEQKALKEKQDAEARKKLLLVCMLALGGVCILLIVVIIVLLCKPKRRKKRKKLKKF